MAKAGAVGHGQWRGRDMAYVCMTMLLPSHYVRRDARQPQRTVLRTVARFQGKASSCRAFEALSNLCADDRAATVAPSSALVQP